MTYETTSDALLGYLAAYLKQSGALPAAVETVRLRDWGGVQGKMEVVLDAEDPEEHEVLLGVEMIDGELILSVSPDDVKQDQDRRWMLGRLEKVLREGFGDPAVCFPEWLEDADAGVRAFEFRVGGSAWREGGKRRLEGCVSWEAKVCLV